MSNVDVQYYKIQYTSVSAFLIRSLNGILCGIVPLFSLMKRTIPLQHCGTVCLMAKMIDLHNRFSKVFEKCRTYTATLCHYER